MVNNGAMNDRTMNHYHMDLIFLNVGDTFPQNMTDVFPPNGTDVFPPNGTDDSPQNMTYGVYD
jgi:hypothetical protein